MDPTPKYVNDFIHNHKTSKEVIVVGQSPSRAAKATSNGTYAVVYSWLTSACVYSWSFLNVIEEEGGDSLKQVDFQRVKQRISPWIGKKVIALGNIASEVLTRLEIDHLQIYHPSGLNRHLNNFDTRIEQIRKIHDYCKKAS